MRSRFFYVTVTLICIWLSLCAFTASEGNETTGGSGDAATGGSGDATTGGSGDATTGGSGDGSGNATAVGSGDGSGVGSGSGSGVGSGSGSGDESGSGSGTGSGNGSGEGSGDGSGNSTTDESGSSATSGGNQTASPTRGITRKCQDGLVLQVWRPLENLTLTDVVVRGIIYFLALSYLFIGVSIVADRFMAAIEVITSSERQVAIKNKNGDREVVSVRVWNETVANLTLMALGSSAPEILLSIIEMFQKNFSAGDLGPGTIVGSAAYNLFVIIGICIAIIPKGQVRRIKHLRVFIVTACWSIFAYIWMYSMLAFITPNRVDIWEGLLTFLFFPMTVFHAYTAECRILCYKYLDKNYQANKRGIVIGSMDAAEDQKYRSSVKELAENAEMRDFEDARREYISTLKELYRKYPQYELERLEAMAQEQLIKSGPKSRAFYRIQATRKMVGSGNPMRRAQDRAAMDIGEVREKMHSVDIDSDEADVEIRVFFEPGHYTVMESCGEFALRVVRRGDLSVTTTVEFYTEDGSAEAGSDYVAKRGVLTFPPGIDEQEFKITIIDDEVFEEDEHFYVHLANPSEPAVLVVPKVATIMVLDDDHCGIFGFEEESYSFPESIGRYMLKVRRFSGARSKVKISYWTEDNTALSSKDYVGRRGELSFGYGETEKFISLEIIEEHSYEKDVIFYVHLGDPFISPDDPYSQVIASAENKQPENLTEADKITLLGRPRLSELAIVELHITESEEFKHTVDKLVQTANASLLIGTSSWKEQFIDALTVSGGVDIVEDEDDDDEDDDDDDEIEDAPGPLDYIMHFLTIFWKVIFAVIPPTKMYDGYVCFFVSIFFIAVATAVLGDVASHFGCMVGLQDAVTAICFVAVGTSLPDTFASMVSAQNDDTADNSVGNVTGSNAVNVFLGIGIAWSMASIYHYFKGEPFVVRAGTLAFSTTLFLTEALLAITLLMYRRKKSIGGELGGPTKEKWISTILMVSLWVIYITLSALEAYGFISGF